MAKFIYVRHPEGGDLAVNLDHIASAHYKRPEGADIKTRLTITLDGSGADIVLFDEEADRVWAVIGSLGERAAGTDDGSELSKF